jgi:hypothetical protein
MLSLQRCKEILQEGSIRLENKTLEELRGYLYQLASLQVEAENNGINSIADGECDFVL